MGATVWDRGETFKVESETVDLWKPKWNENQTACAAAIHTPDGDLDSLEGAVSGSYGLGIVKQSQGKSVCYWLWRDRSRGCEGGDCGGKCLWRKSWQPWKQGDTAESRIGGGAITIASLSPHTASRGSWTIERLAHQTPDTLNYRVGPHPGCPFKCLTGRSIVGPQPGNPSTCLTLWKTEKGPRQGSPLSASTGTAREKDWPKRPSDPHYKRLEKRLW